jgi:hypothetical protein
MQFVSLQMYAPLPAALPVGSKLITESLDLTMRIISFLLLCVPQAIHNLSGLDLTSIPKPSLLY